TPIETNEISVYVPIGSEAWQLVLDLTGLQTSINLTGWTATPDPTNERILFKPNTGHATLTPEQGITVQLNKLRINRQVGTAPVTIELKWRTPGTTNWRTEQQTLSIGKFPAGFYLRNLKADPPHYIENGDSVTLTWERSTIGSETYHLLYENTEIDVTKYSTLPVHDIRRNTMLYLRGRIQQGTGTAERTINTYITVNKPDLEVGTLHVNQTTSLAGPVLALKATWVNQSLPYSGWVKATAPTDGILTVTMVKNSEVKIKIGTNEAVTVRSMYNSGTWDHSYASFPVPQGSEMAIERVRQGDSAREFPEFLWYAFGDGQGLTFRQ
ncbi:hypothetical protein CG747_45360, partial [Streptomyces sp. CB02959]|uniref:hypothetical protein n=1 Tax=Streptomyces sp. CB02959 TaxID=2020330 RepID=UPI000C274288